MNVDLMIKINELNCNTVHQLQHVTKFISIRAEEFYMSSLALIIRIAKICEQT